MSYDEDLAGRIRGVLAGEPGTREQKMFGGIAFMVRGHMCVGVLGDELIVRLGDDAAETALGRPFVREMDFTGRPMRSMVMVGPEGLRGRALRGWVQRALAFVDSLPARAWSP